MNLSQFCENLFKEDGFILIDANSKEYVIGKPKKNPPINKLTSKRLIKNQHSMVTIYHQSFNNSSKTRNH